MHSIYFFFTLTRKKKCDVWARVQALIGFSFVYSIEKEKNKNTGALKQMQANLNGSCAWVAIKIQMIYQTQPKFPHLISTPNQLKRNEQPCRINDKWKIHGVKSNLVIKLGYDGRQRYAFLNKWSRFMESSLSWPKVPYSKDNTIRSHPTNYGECREFNWYLFSTFTHITGIRGNNKSNQRKKN